MRAKNPIIQISTTSDQKEELEKIAKELLAKKLAACCQISGPITSHYYLEGKLETTSEWICSIKTESVLFSEVESAIKELHHYDEPEIIAVDVVDASEGYQTWVIESVHKSAN